MLKRALFFLIIFFPSYLYAQAMVSLKMVDLKSKNVITLGEKDRGKVWIDSEGKRVFIYDGDKLNAFTIRENMLIYAGELFFESDSISVTGWEKVFAEDEKKKNTNTRLVPRFYGSMLLRDVNPMVIATDVKGERLFVADNRGYIYVFDIEAKEYKGRLLFGKKSVRYLRTLKNGGLLIIYDDNSLSYIEPYKIPFFSFLQDLKSSYELKKSVIIPLNFISSVNVNPKEDKIIITGDHKTLIAVSLPSLQYEKIYEERLFIEYADFIDNDLVLYMTLKERSLEQRSDFKKGHHFRFLSGFFDLRRTITESPSGSFIVRISEKDSLDIFEMKRPSKLGSIDFDYKNYGQLVFGSDDKTIIAIDKDRSKILLYRLQEQPQR